MFAVFITVWSFFFVRWCLAYSWNNNLADEAMKGTDEIRNRYINWSLSAAIFSPRHWNKWTSHQWIRYLKGEKK